MTPDDLVLIDINGAVATLTLNRPDKANALSREMLDALMAALRTAEADIEVKVLVIAANGKIFSAGHDLAELRSFNDAAAITALFERCSEVMTALRASRLPVIAKVQGAAVAAGCQLVATADLAYAVETAKFGVNGINIGLFCATPAVALSRAILPKQALELLMTGRLMLAPRAVEVGLINAAVPAEVLDSTVAKVASEIAAKLAPAIDLGKDLFWQQLGLSTEEAYAAAGSVMAQNLLMEETGAMIDSFLARH